MQHPTPQQQKVLLDKIILFSTNTTVRATCKLIHDTPFAPKKSIYNVNEKRKNKKLILNDSSFNPPCIRYIIRILNAQINK